MIIEFTGHSDDIVMYDLLASNRIRLKRDEINVSSDEPTAFVVQTIGGARSCRVIAHYDETGCWCFAVALIDEDRPLPPWRFSICAGHGYSTRLVIDTGDDDVLAPTRGGLAA